MQLVIDIGNTRIKAALFESDELVEKGVFSNTSEFIQSDFLANTTVSACILCSVVNDFAVLQEFLGSRFPVLVFTAQTPVPVRNLYKSAASLGSDRLAAAVGASTMADGNPALVIDAGTCIKYNLLTADNSYLGGAISPGLKMRFKAMHTFTSRLPLLEPETGFHELIGRDTRESLLSGAQEGAVFEMEGAIAAYHSHFNNLSVFLTGGDADFFAKRLKNPIFADQNLILKGLNKILSHNR